jgi:hypothetical protein
MGVVAGFWAVVLIRQGPQARNLDTSERSKLLQRLQEVRTICKTRSQLLEINLYAFGWTCLLQSSSEVALTT